MRWMKFNVLKLIVLLLALSSMKANAQLQASNWYFGFNAGIRFDPVSNTVTPLIDGQVSTNEGCATISDENGNLLFYTDGITVFDRNHMIMQNGQGLRGDPSSTQSAIIIPKPQDPNIYYIFTVDTQVGANDPDTGLHWYEVDMTLNLGQGAVVTNVNAPNNLMLLCSEKITAINHGTNDEILVTAFGSFNGNLPTFDTFHTFRVTPTGVNPVAIKSQVASNVTGGGRRGNLKISPDGQYMVSCNMGSGTYLYDYDQNTGQVSNERRFLFPGANQAGYGVEFSPDGSLVYITASNDAGGNTPSNHSSTLYQFNLNDPNIVNSGIDIDTRQGYRGSLQLGIDKKIYRALSDSYDGGRSFLGVINNPNVLGTGCNYQHDAIALNGRLSTQGLPPFIQSFFALIEAENTCLGDATDFSFATDTVPTGIDWDFGDGNTSTLENPQHTYAAAGTYNVVLTLTINGAVRTYRKTVQIYDLPTAYPVTNISECDLDRDGSMTFDLDTDITPIILGSQDPTLFSVSYFASQADADSNTAPLNNPHTAVSSPLTIYARISNTANPECYDSTSFDIEFFTQPTVGMLSNLEVCDDNFDGFMTFDLSIQDSIGLDGQSSADFEITYHPSQLDADNNTNALPNNYTNTTAFNETVFVRVENRQGTQCADTSQSFDLVVQPKPLANDTNAFQCDEDGVPDSQTIFNLSEFDNTVAAAASGMTVTYHLSLSDAENAINELNNTSYTNTSPSQTIFARVTDNATGCYNTSTITLSVSASDAQDTFLESCDDDGVEDGLTNFNLSDADSSVLASAPPNVTVNYYATLNEALTEQNTLPTNYTNTTANNQIIFARAESPDGNCYGISEVELIVNDLPMVEPVELVDYCGNNPQPLTIDAGMLPGSTSDYTYLWDTNETTYSIQVTNGGNYSVQVMNTNGCSSTRVITVIISDAATINSIDVAHAGTGPNGSATINASGLGDYEYRINLDDPFQDSNIFENLEPGFYTAYVRDKNGCGTVEQDFSIIGYPRFFTPNNDGFNDFWQLIGTSVLFEPDAQIFIFDRYGKLLAQIPADGPGWDGTYNNAPMPSSDYWFTATLADGIKFTSHFSLKR